MPEIIPVILAGGEGRRLWPLSRPARPKAFIKMSAGLSFLQTTAARAGGFHAPIIACNARHRELVEHQIRACNIKPTQIFLEPEGRGTAPAVAVAAHYFSETNPFFLVMPSDHAIGSPEILIQAVHDGLSQAAAGMFVLFGVRPRRPADDFGYIRQGKALDNAIFTASDFVEKPDRATAQGMLAQGDWLWNSGIFLFSAETFLSYLAKTDPAFSENSYQAVARASRIKSAVFLEESAFCACPSVSLDRAIMEKADNRAVIPVDMGWSDLGTWPSFVRHWLKTAGKSQL